MKKITQRNDHGNDRQNRDVIGWGFRASGRWLLSGLLLSLVVTAGCVTNPEPVVPDSGPAVVSTGPVWPGTAPAGYATVLMYTTRRSVGSGPSVYVDDVEAFKLHWHSYTWVSVRAGNHVIRTKWGIGLGGLNAAGNVNLVAGKNYFLKLSESDDYYSFSEKEDVSESLRTVSEAVALKEAVGCEFRPPMVRQIDSVGTGQPAATLATPPGNGSMAENVEGDF